MAEALLPVVAFDAKWREEEYPAWSKKVLNTAAAAPGQARVWKLLRGELQQVALPGDLEAAATADEKAERAAAVKSANERNELCREAERQAAFWLVQCIETNDEALPVWDGLTDAEQKSGSVTWVYLSTLTEGLDECA